MLSKLNFCLVQSLLTYQLTFICQKKTSCLSSSISVKMPEGNPRVAIVGGGLVGSLAACVLAKRGYQIELYEARQDIRQSEHVRGRSINLALSVRGVAGLLLAGLKEKALSQAIAMEGRLIHDVTGVKHFIRYGDHTQAIYSIGRRYLNEILLDEAEKYPNVKCHFNHKLIHANLLNGQLSFNCSSREGRKVSADLVVGCDGAFSAVRRHIKTICNYSQTFLDHGYMEFSMPPTSEGHFAMESNCLHIWPRNDFMLIALPNYDHTYTVTLFMPLKMFQELDSDDQILQFFKKNFPDALPLLGQRQVIEEYKSMKASYLLTVKCRPINVASRAVLLGDSAHAMAPFYGQGMNCGFEDCEILNTFLDHFNDDFSKVLPAFSDYRCSDIETICDLALYNYIEMRHLVNTWSFIMRKYLDRFLYWMIPKKWVPLYTMVTFTRIRYHQCLSHRRWQDKIISRLGLLATLGLVMSLTAIIYNQIKPGNSF
ncbi:hypothetical protein CHUAL_009542 [Chamberlinius hualienensis]